MNGRGEGKEKEQQQQQQRRRKKDGLALFILGSFYFHSVYSKQMLHKVTHIWGNIN